MTLLESIHLPPVTRYLLSREQYHRMIESGILPESSAYKLLHGMIAVKDRADAEDDSMSGGKKHRKAVIKLGTLDPKFRKRGCFIQLQQPIALSKHSEPEPDGSVVLGDDDEYDDHPRPKDITCVIEAADHSLDQDRTTKLELYASAKIAMYVVLNLVDRIAEVHTHPQRGGYRYKVTLTERDVLSLPCAKGKTLDVVVASVMP